MTTQATETDSYANGPTPTPEFAKATAVGWFVNVEIGNLSRQLTPGTALKLATDLRIAAKECLKDVPDA